MHTIVFAILKFKKLYFKTLLFNIVNAHWLLNECHRRHLEPLRDSCIKWL